MVWMHGLLHSPDAFNTHRTLRVDRPRFDKLDDLAVVLPNLLCHAREDVVHDAREDIQRAARGGIILAMLASGGG